MASSETKCPYCKVEFEVKPSRKKKCSICGNYIYVRKGKLVTEENAHIIDWLQRLEGAGLTVSRKQFDEERQNLTKRFGKLASINDTCWGILNRLVTQQKDRKSRAGIYRLMADVVITENKDPKPYLAEAITQELLEYKESGVVSEVVVYTVNDNHVCNSCRLLSGKRFTIDDALSKMPIPHLCEKIDGCRCWYGPVI